MWRFVQSELGQCIPNWRLADAEVWQQVQSEFRQCLSIRQRIRPQEISKAAVFYSLFLSMGPTEQVLRNRKLVEKAKKETVSGL